MRATVLRCGIARQTETPNGVAASTVCHRRRRRAQTGRRVENNSGPRDFAGLRR